MFPLVFPDHQALSHAAARWLTAVVGRSPSSLLCLATGGTPTCAYELFVEAARKRPELRRRLRVLKLDEWGGLPMNDPATCETYLQRSIVRPLGLGRRYVGFHSNPAVPEKECARVGGWLAENGPIDVCVLGLGLNGHIAFNEPAAFLHPQPHLARLAPASLRHAMLKQTRRRPRFGLTLGMANLLQAGRILLLVSGPAKRRPLVRLLRGEITPRFPASFLWLHPNVTLLCDQQAL